MTKQTRKRALTGSRPSGIPHIGNYLGSFKPALELATNYELFFFLADFHALNHQPDPTVLKQQSLELTATMLALGLDPEQVVFYTQSGSPRVHELTWIISCVAPYGMLTRAHSFKDAQAKGVDVNMGVFNYPLLMTADILLYDANIVPVGKDQKQHLEMARDFAGRFNNQYKSETFIAPEPLISEKVAIVPGIDGEKMSSSKGNVISIFSNPKGWKTQIMSIVTDSKGVAESKDPDQCNIFKIYSLLASSEQVALMRDKYSKGGYGYGHAKLDLLAIITELFSKASESYFELLKHPDDLKDILQKGSNKARLIADKKLEKVYEQIGFLV